MNLVNFVRARILMAVQLPEDKQLAYLTRGRKKANIDAKDYLDLLVEAQDHWEDHVDEYVVDADNQGNYAWQEYLDCLDGPPGLYPFTSSIPSDLPDGDPSIIDTQDPAKMKILITRYMQANGCEGETQEADLRLTSEKKTDGRANNKKQNIIIPAPEFWAEVKDFTEKHETKVYKNSKGNPTENFIVHLQNKDFLGHEKSDRYYTNPIPLTKYTIRERLKEYFQTL